MATYYSEEEIAALRIKYRMYTCLRMGILLVSVLLAFFVICFSLSSLVKPMSWQTESGTFYHIKPESIISYVCIVIPFLLTGWYDFILKKKLGAELYEEYMVARIAHNLGTIRSKKLEKLIYGILGLVLVYLILLVLTTGVEFMRISDRGILMNGKSHFVPTVISFRFDEIEKIDFAPDRADTIVFHQKNGEEICYQPFRYQLDTKVILNELDQKTDGRYELTAKYDHAQDLLRDLRESNQ